MRRSALILILSCAVFSAPLFAEVPADFYIETEYKKDSIDYSETERYYYREKLSVLFSGESSLNLGYVYIEQEKERRYTYNLILNDVSPDFSFMLGNYFVNFGYGLIVARKMAFERDVFSSRAGDNNHGFFFPCKSGNPLYSFRGITASWDKKMMDVKMSLNFFYSINERFIDTESYEYGSIYSSMAAIEGRDDKTFNAGEPVNISTSGGLIALQAMDAFTLQIFYIFTKIKSNDKDEILWDSYDTYNAEYGTSSVLGNGFLLEYRDDFLNIFCEGSMTTRGMYINDEKENVHGYGLLYGIRFKPPFLKMSLTGKQMDGRFYSPYSSSIGDDYPEDAFFFDTEISPFRNLKIGSALSSQKKTAAGSRDDCSPVTERQKIYVNYNYGMLDEFSVTGRRVEKSDEDGRGEKYQLKEKAAFKLFKSLSLEAASIYQQGGLTGHSIVYQGGIEASILSKFKLSINYASARISDGNNIYMTISPIPNSSSPGIMIQEDSNIIISKLDFKHKEIYVSFRYLYQYHNDAALHRQLEFSASGKF